MTLLALAPDDQTFNARMLPLVSRTFALSIEALALVLATLCEVERGEDVAQTGREPKVRRDVEAAFTGAERAVESNETLSRFLDAASTPFRTE